MAESGPCPDGGLAGIVATIITGAGYLGPNIKKINAIDMVVKPGCC